MENTAQFSEILMSRKISGINMSTEAGNVSRLQLQEYNLPRLPWHLTYSVQYTLSSAVKQYLLFQLQLQDIQENTLMKFQVAVKKFQICSLIHPKRMPNMLSMS